eukprot:2679235-Prymnesium_polylepis.4
MAYTSDDGICTDCPDGGIPVIVGVSALLGVCILLYGLYMLLYHPPDSLQTTSMQLNMLANAVHSLGPSKAKAAVTFYQIILSLPGSFDLDPVPDDLSAMLGYFRFIEFDWSEAVYPTGCLVGGYRSRILLVGLFPFILIIAAPLMLLAVAFLAAFFRSSGSTDGAGRRPSLGIFLAGQATAQSRKQSISAGGEVLSEWKARMLKVLPWVLLVVFVFIPGVSRSLFAVWDWSGQQDLNMDMSRPATRICPTQPRMQCLILLSHSRSYSEAYKSGPTSSLDYLRRDQSITCGESDHNGIVALAIVFVLLWPVGMQVLFFMTLWTNRHALRAGRENSYSRATRFLTGGYKPDYFYCAQTCLDLEIPADVLIILC